MRARDVDCPRCSARAGERCRDLTGAVTIHADPGRAEWVARLRALEIERSVVRAVLVDSDLEPPAPVQRYHRARSQLARERRRDDRYYWRVIMRRQRETAVLLRRRNHNEESPCKA